MHRKAIRALGMAAALLAGAALPGFCGTLPARRVNAHKLVQIAAESCAGAVRGFDAPERPELREARVQPLRSALAAMTGLVAEVGARLNTRDLGFFRALRAGTKTLAEVRLALPRSGLHDAGIERQIQTLDEAYSRLRNRYGEEWLRFRSGKPVNEEERHRFEAMRTAQSHLAGKLTPLEEKARRAGDAATAGELALLITQANSIAEAPATLEEILNAAVLNDTMQGEYAATRDANPVDEPEWAAADRAVEDLQTDTDVGFVFTTDLSSVQQWSYTEEPTEFPDPSAEPGPEPAMAGAEPVADLLTEPAADFEVEPQAEMETELREESAEPAADEDESAAAEEPEDAVVETGELEAGQLLELPPGDEPEVVAHAPEASTPAPAPAPPAKPPVHGFLL